MYGDTETGRRRVAQVREQASDLRALADRLVARAEAVPWQGRAAEAMRARIRERAAHLREAAGQHETAGDSLTRHLAAVDAAKEAIDARERRVAALVEDARARASAGSAEPGDAALLAFTPPPRGHRDWLAVELPGL